MAQCTIKWNNKGHSEWKSLCSATTSYNLFSQASWKSGIFMRIILIKMFFNCNVLLMNVPLVFKRKQIRSVDWIWPIGCQHGTRGEAYGSWWGIWQSFTYHYWDFLGWMAIEMLQLGKFKFDLNIRITGSFQWWNGLLLH